jgi:hypothetical protein
MFQQHNNNNKYLSIVVQLLGRFNNITFLHNLTSALGFATALTTEWQKLNRVPY